MEDPSLWVFEDERYDTKKHMTERAQQGFSEYDWWNFTDYIAWVNIQALERFKSGSGFPGDLRNMDEWVAELEIMVDGFRAKIEMDNDWDEHNIEERKARYEKGMNLYIKRLSHLWD